MIILLVVMLFFAKRHSLDLLVSSDDAVYFSIKKPHYKVERPYAGEIDDKVCPACGHRESETAGCMEWGIQELHAVRVAWGRGLCRRRNDEGSSGKV